MDSSLCVQALPLADLEAGHAQEMKAKADLETARPNVEGSRPSMHLETLTRGSPLKDVSLPSLADHSINHRKASEATDVQACRC